MNKLIIAILLFVSVSFGQNKSARGEMSYSGVLNFRTGTQYNSWSASARSDTMQTVYVDEWSNVYYVIENSDSISVAVSYIPIGYTGTAYPAVLIDSLSSATANMKSFKLPIAGAGLRGVRFVRTVNVFQLGVTTPTVKEKILRIK